jgi:hypothetical protein
VTHSGSEETLLRWTGWTSCARSKREIEAHTDELGDIGMGRYFIDEAAQLLAALRLWAQNQYRSDRVVRDILEAGRRRCSPGGRPRAATAGHRRRRVGQLDDRGDDEQVLG